MAEFSMFNLFMMLVVGLFAGTINAMAGGGGLLTIPALMAIGIPPLGAIATNYPPAVAANISASFRFWQHGQLHLNIEWPRALISLFFGICGGIAVQHIPNDFLKLLIPIMLILIALWLITNPQAGNTVASAKISERAYSMFVLPWISFYDGFFGPCGGTFYAISAVSFLGKKLSDATASAKFYNVFGGLGGFLTFMFSPHIHWGAALAMLVGTMSGSYIGASLVIKHGTGLVRIALVVISITTSLKLLWDHFA
jgi:uncharacterized protein